MFNHLPLIDFDELSFEDGENSVTIIFISSFNLSRFSKKKKKKSDLLGKGGVIYYLL